MLTHLVRIQLVIFGIVALVGLLLMTVLFIQLPTCWASARSPSRWNCLPAGGVCTGSRTSPTAASRSAR